MAKEPITKNTSISLGIVLVIAGAAIAWGILTTKVMNIEDDMQEVKSEITAIRDILMNKNLTLK